MQAYITSYPPLIDLFFGLILSIIVVVWTPSVSNVTMMKVALLVSLTVALFPAVLGFAPVPFRARNGVRHSKAAVPWRGTNSNTHPLAAVINIDENASREIGAMDEWATNVGVQRVEGFQLTSEDGLDWSVMTTQPIAANSAVLLVPNNVILTSSRARQELEQLGNVQDAVDQLGRLGAGDQIPLFYLFLKVLLEYERGDQSPYFPWLNSLPRLYFNAVSMTDFCYECLPPLVFSLARAERVKVDNFFAALQEVNFLSQQTKANKNLAKWAFNVVTTRCRGPANEKQIVPMADMVRTYCIMSLLDFHSMDAARYI